jgi:hypothetical protein
MRRALLLLAVGVVLAPSPAPAQSWFDSIVPEKSFDFGTVARGSKLRHSFRLVNTTSYDIHIADTRAKCGCTDVKLGARDIPPGTQTVIEATLDTTRFVGFKPSGLTLVLDRPEFVEIDLNLTCFIRGDVLVNPGVADFGQVARGSSPTLAMNLTYAGGQADWAINQVHTIGSHVSAQARRVSGGNGSAQYQITVTLNPTAPSGFFKDEVTLHTNDPGSPSIPISVSAHIQAAVNVYPSPLVLGTVKAGSVVSRDLLVRSSKPFKLTQISGKKGEWTTPPPGDASQTMHRFKVSLKAPAQPGPYNAVLEIATDLKDEPPAKVTAFATVVP